MNFGGFSFGLGYKNKNKKDENSSLLFNEPESPTFAQNPLKSSNSKQLFDNDAAFDDMFDSPNLKKESNSINKPTITKEIDLLADFGDFTSASSFAVETSKVESILQKDKSKTSTSFDDFFNPVASNQTIETQFTEFNSFDNDDGYGDFVTAPSNINPMDKQKNSNPECLDAFFDFSAPISTTSTSQAAKQSQKTYNSVDDLLGLFDSHTIKEEPKKTKKEVKKTPNKSFSLDNVQTNLPFDEMSLVSPKDFFVEGLDDIKDDKKQNVSKKNSFKKEHHQRKHSRSRSLKTYSHFDLEPWFEICSLIEFEFKNATQLLTQLDHHLLPQDRNLLSDYKPISNYIKGLFEMNQILERMRLAINHYKLDSSLPPMNNELFTQFSNVHQLVMRLTLTTPKSDILSFDASQDSERKCTVCFLPLENKDLKLGHLSCITIKKKALENPLKIKTDPPPAHLSWVESGILI